MKIFSSILLCLLFFTLMGFRLFPDEKILEKILASFNEYNEPDQEKVYLHLDKPYYSGGETIWFKLYLVEAKTNLPSTLSKIAYVDLVDHKNKLIKQKKLQVKKGVASGEFLLEDNLEEGEYSIIAYTNWMRNLNQDLWYKKEIAIYKPGPEIASSTQLVEFNNIQFFPEGGYLVDDLESKIGYKSVDQYGNGLPVSGIISNSRGDTITTFTSSELGMGSFILRPEKMESYIAKIFIKDTVFREFPLPESLLQGFVMSVKNELKDSLSINISGNISTNNSTGYLIAQSKGKIHYKTSLNLHPKGETGVNISKNSLPEGVAQLTLFSSSGEPVAERLIFINQKNTLQINISSDKSSYLPREKITLQFQVNDQEGNPLSSNLSLAITDTNIFGEGKPAENIITYLNLSSEIKGKIENPAWYLGAHKEEALDDLLLTQGWRRFTWEEILNGQAPETNFYVEDELALRGRVIDNSTGKRALGSSVTMTISGEHPQYLFDLTDDKGIFVFHELNLSGPQTFFLKAIEKYSKEESLEVKIDSIPSPIYNFRPTGLYTGSELSNGYKKLIRDKNAIDETFEYYMLAEGENNILVNQQINSDTKKAPVELNYHADEVIEMENYLSFSSMVDVIRELVRGVIIRRKGDQYRLRVLDSVTKFYFKKEPFYIVDGIPVDNVNEIMNMDPSIVKLITVSKPPDNFYDFGVLGESGVLAVYTTEMNQIPEKSSKALKVNFKGYDRPREFYSPDHGSKTTPTNIPDFRPLLYWNPSIITDNEGKATISFYASDDVTNWQVNVVGLSDSGIPGVGQLYFESKFPEN